MNLDDFVVTFNVTLNTKWKQVCSVRRLSDRLCVLAPSLTNGKNGKLNPVLPLTRLHFKFIIRFVHVVPNQIRNKAKLG